MYIYIYAHNVYIYIFTHDTFDDIYIYIYTYTIRKLMMTGYGTNPAMAQERFIRTMLLPTYTKYEYYCFSHILSLCPFYIPHLHRPMVGFISSVSSIGCAEAHGRKWKSSEDMDGSSGY